ncbi:MAG: PAS domain-containing protein [Anaerolineae bacterium]|nr:PAS domain-containing protein [Anaerolineae bacterium]
MKLATRLLQVSTADPDDARRRKLLNIMLFGIMAIVVVGSLATAIADVAHLIAHDEVVSLVYVASIAALTGSAIIWIINRYASGQVASVLFLLLLTVIIAFSDEARQVVEGRSVFLFTIPILMASVTLRPWASFVVAGLSSVLVSVIAVSIRPDYVPPIPTMLGFFAVALVSWLAARSLEVALADLRAINAELDRRVLDRTRELATTLSENQAILESIADGVIMFSPDGRAVVANPAISLLLTKPPEQIVGRDMETLMEHEVDVQDRQLMTRLLQGDTALAPTFKLEWGRKTLSVSCAPVHSETGSAVGTVAVFRDFTREAELDRMKSAFVSTVSHELRTPLNAILGYADMLHEAVFGALSERQSEVMQRLVANANRLLSLVNDLLDSAQIEAGTLSLNFSQVQPADLMRDMHSTMVVLSNAKKLDLICRIDPDMPEVVFGDAQRLHQILLNLVNNAVKFTEQGAVTVNIFSSGDTHWSIEVIDTGPGIPPEAMAHMFEPFHSVDSSATRRHRGAGLGLSIVKQLAELMGGTVSVSSELDQGSTFTVQLPVKPPDFSKESLS